MDISWRLQRSWYWWGLISASQILERGCLIKGSLFCFKYIRPCPSLSFQPQTSVIPNSFRNPINRSLQPSERCWNKFSMTHSTTASLSSKTQTKKNHKFLNFFSRFFAESATSTHIYIMRGKMEEKWTGIFKNRWKSSGKTHLFQTILFFAAWWAKT